MWCLQAFSVPHSTICRYHQRQERVVLRKLKYTPSARTFSRTPSAQSVELEKHQSAIFEAAGDAVGKPYTDTQTFICAPLKAMLQQIGLMAKAGNASDQVLAGQHMCASLVAKVYQRCELLKPPFKVCIVTYDLHTCQFATD